MDGAWAVDDGAMSEKTWAASSLKEYDQKRRKGEP
jgi:hypothetical protein